MPARSPLHSVLALVTLVWFTATVCLAQEQGGGDPSFVDSSEAGEFNLFLFCFAIAGLVALVVLLVLGCALGVVAFAAASGVTLLGITATSVATGFVKRSPATGLAVFLVQAGAFVGVVTGLAGGWLLGFFAAVHEPLAVRLFSGGLAGLLVGAGAAGAAAWVWRRLARTLGLQLEAARALRSAESGSGDQ